MRKLGVVLLGIGMLIGVVGCGSMLGERPGEAVKAEQVTRAVCIGWNEVDGQKWGGWKGKLSDCEFDAKFWHETWGEAGIQSTLLLTKQATIVACREALKETMGDMVKGDTLIVCVSGHGGQGPDSIGEGADGLGEYICAYDGPVTDNTINEWLQMVPAGVRILWICDTCHSGTMYRSKPVSFRKKAVPGDFAGELILLAGCAEDGYSLSTGQGGMWSTALHDTGPEGMSPKKWFEAAKGRIPESEQVPVYSEYGKVSRSFRNGILVNRQKR